MPVYITQDLYHGSVMSLETRRPGDTKNLSSVLS